MRRIVLATALFLAGCATRPEQPAPPEPVPEAPAPRPSHSNNLIGVSAGELVGRFGNPALQLREGTSVKLQFRGRDCVLDAYLYPSSGGQLRVTHIDTRMTSGQDMDQATCVASLQFPS